MADSIRPRPGAALALSLVFSTLLAPVLVVGPFIAGFAGGRKARLPGGAVITALPAAVLWAGVWWWLAGRALQIKEGDVIDLTALGFRVLAPSTALAIVGGALTGSSQRPARVVGAVLGVFALAWVVARVQWRDTRNLYELTRREPAETAVVNQACPDHLKKLYDAAMLYAQSWDDTLPPAETWMTALADPGQRFAEDLWLHCPEVGGGASDGHGYAMNNALGGKRLPDLADRKVELFYDSATLDRDAHDSVTSLPKPGRHGGRNNVILLTGAIEER